MSNLHELQAHNQGIHQSYDWVWADESARLAQNVALKDVYKKGFQLDESTEWTLFDITPTWILVGGGIGSSTILTPTTVVFTITPDISTFLSRCSMQLKDQNGDNLTSNQFVRYWVTSSPTDPSFLSTTVDSFIDDDGVTIELLGDDLVLAFAETDSTGLLAITVVSNGVTDSVWMWIAFPSGIRFVSPEITYSP